MVKSPSCFKVITCGKTSVEGDDLEVTQEKGSNDKRGWSFRKKSTRNRVLSNSVTADSPILGIKEHSESATVNFESQPDAIIPDKISVVHCNDEKPHLATYLKPEVVETVVIEEVPDKTVVKEEVPDKTVVKEEVPESAVKPEEPDSVVLKEEVPETAAKPEEPNSVVVAKEEVLETAVKPEELDSVINEGVSETTVAKEVPDDLVAVENDNGSDAKIDESAVIAIQTAARGFLARRELRKLKKLVKLQAAVRGHIVRRHAVGTLRCVQAIVKMQTLVRARHARLSTEPDLKNDTLVKKSSVSNASMEKLLGNRFAQQMLDSTPKAKPIHVKCDPSKTDSAWKWLERWMWASSDNAASEPKKVVAVAVADDHENEKNVKFDDSLPETKIEPEIICESVGSKCSSVHESTAPSESEDNLIIYEAGKFDFQTTTSVPRENSEQPEFENASTSDVGETASDIGALTSKDDQSRVDLRTPHESPCEDPEVEAEQPKPLMERLASEELEERSKFEELAEESHKDLISSEAQSVIRTQEISKTESPVHWLRNRVAGSECGTELSITSTLDSPDRSEIVAMEHVPGAKVSEEVVCDLITNANSEDVLSANQEKLDDANVETGTPVVAEELPKAVEPNPETPGLQKEKKHETRAQQAEAASPMSHVTVPESQGTPSSQVSVKTEKRNIGSGKKRASPSSSIKKSPPSTTKHENSGSRSNTAEKQLLKEQKSAKRRNSFGSPKPENGDQEPRDSNGSDDRNANIPHFMQATQSARAKLNAAAASSPRSSPDVGEGETFLKKRHSFPAAASTGRQGSPPRAQRSKGNNERKWQR